MSTYSPNLALELISTGDQAGAWGNTTNNNLGTLIEQAISGYVTQAVATGTDTTITIPNGESGVARNMFIELTGTGGTNTNLVVPTNKKLYFIYNNTAGPSGQVTVKVSGQTGVSVPAGAKALLVCNGTDVVVATSYLGTPVFGVLTNCTDLPVATGISGLGTNVATALSNNANSAAGLITGTGTATLQNKRIDPRVSSTTSAASITPDISSFDQYCLTAQAATLTINAPIGTPLDGDKLLFRILDNGVAQTLSWNATFTAIGVLLPTTTTAGKMLYVGCIYNAANTRWDVVAAITQA